MKILLIYLFLHLTILGWDKSGSAGTGAITIHHPKGDVKKISTSVSSAINYTRPLGSSSGNTHWEVSFNKGIVEPGSSGSPLLNNDHKIIGQLHGHKKKYHNYPPCDIPSFYCGKFNISWIGTFPWMNPKRKLQPWLDPLGSDQNTLEGMFPLKIIGTNVICGFTDYTRYILKNSKYYLSITWETSPNLEIYSSNSLAIIVKKIGSGPGYIKAIYKGAEIIKYVTVGSPSISLTTLNGIGPYGQLDATVTGGFPPYKWYKNGNLIHTSTQEHVTLQFGCDGGLLKVSSSNTCGTSTASTLITRCNNYFSMYPNPASGMVTLELNKEEESYTTRSVHTANSYRVDVYNMSGYVVRSIKGQGAQVQIPLQGLLPGVYSIHLVKDGKTYQKKLIVE